MMASAAMYCRKTMGALDMMDTGWWNKTENMRDPGGEIQTLDPLPRPAT